MLRKVAGATVKGLSIVWARGLFFATIRCKPTLLRRSGILNTLYFKSQEFRHRMDGMAADQSVNEDQIDPPQLQRTQTLQASIRGVALKRAPVL